MLLSLSIYVLTVFLSAECYVYDLYCRDYLRSTHYVPASVDTKLSRLARDSEFSRLPSKPVQPTLFSRDNSSTYTINNTGSGSITINMVYMAK